MNIEIPDHLYKDLLDHVQKRYLSDDPSEFIQGLIYKELTLRCHPGYEIDQLTKCNNRSKLEQDINQATWGDGSQDHSLFHERYLCIDIDNFKIYIDKHGLTEGDEILVDIANKLRDIYSVENIYRYGGDEFIVILGEKDARIPEVHPEISLKHSVVDIAVSKNQRKNHHINSEINLYLAKGIVESTMDGTDLNYRNEI